MEGHDIDVSNPGLENNIYPLNVPMTEPKAQAVFGGGPGCSQELLALNTTVRLTGVRPVSSYGQMPIIKRYVGRKSPLATKNLLLGAVAGCDRFLLTPASLGDVIAFEGTRGSGATSLSTPVMGTYMHAHNKSAQGSTVPEGAPGHAGVRFTPAIVTPRRAGEGGTGQLNPPGAPFDVVACCCHSLMLR